MADNIRRVTLNSLGRDLNKLMIEENSILNDDHEKYTETASPKRDHRSAIVDNIIKKYIMVTHLEKKDKFYKTKSSSSTENMLNL